MYDLKSSKNSGIGSAFDNRLKSLGNSFLGIFLGSHGQRETGPPDQPFSENDEGLSGTRMCYQKHLRRMQSIVDSFDAFHQHMADVSLVPALCFEDEGYDFSTQPTASYKVAAVEPLNDLKEHINCVGGAPLRIARWYIALFCCFMAYKPIKHEA